MTSRVPQQGSPSTRAPGESDGWRFWLAACLLFAGLGFAVSFGSGRGLVDHSYGGSVNIDAGSHIWYLWHLKEAVLGRVGLFHSDRIFYPMGVDLVSQDWEPVVGLMALPFQGIGPLFAFNMQFWLAYLFTGLATTLLARRLGARRGAALLAGVIFAFCEYRILKAHYHGQPGYVHQEFLPLYVLLLWRFLEAGRTRHALLAGLCFFAATFCTPYQLVFLAMMTLVVMAGWLAAPGSAGGRTPDAGGRTPDAGGRTPDAGIALPARALTARRCLAFFLLAGGAALLLALPVLLLNRQALSAALDVVGLSTLRAPADLLSYTQSAITPGPEIGRSLDETRVAYMGRGLLLLSAVSLALVALRRGGGAGLWLAGALLFFLLSLGDRLTVGGEPGLSLPFYPLLRQVPVAGGVRMASRFASMVAFCLALAAALAVTRLGALGPLARRPRLLGVLELLAVAAVAAELSAPRLLDLARNPDLPHSLPRTPAVRRLAAMPEMFTLLTYPPVWETRTNILGSSAYPPHRMMARQVLHRKRLLTGTGDAIPPETFIFFSHNQFFIRIMDIMEGQPVPEPTAGDRQEALALMRRLDVRYVLLHRDRLTPDGKPVGPFRYHTAEAAAYLRALLPLEVVLQDRQELLLRVAP